VSIGIQSSPEVLVEKVARFIEQGYKRIKLKVAPGRDLQFVEAVFRAFPNVPLMIDANSAYTLESAKVFEEMNRYKLLMIEQPLHETDVYQHSLLAKRVTNPICLDESIESVRDAEAAIELGACAIINIKPGRVGGLTEARRIHDLCASRSVPVWCGGMLESGVGRAANMALATLPGFTLPGDISESSRYYRSDIVEPEIKFSQAGDLRLREEPGIGFDVNLERLKAVTELEEVVSVA
jgi:O-succinylbenzoate synthase